MKNFLLLMRDNPNVAVAITVFPAIGIISLFYNSAWVSVSVMIACFSSMVWLVRRESGAFVSGLFALSSLAAIFAAFADNPRFEKALSISELSVHVYSNMSLYGLAEADRERVFESISTCLQDGSKAAQATARDLAGTVYEPVEAGAFSWIWKQNEPATSCLDIANDLAARSEEYKARLNIILEEQI